MIFPIAAQINVIPDGQTVSEKFIHSTSNWDFIRKPRLFIILMAIVKIERSGQLQSPGIYILEIRKMSDVKLYRALPHNVN